MAKRTEPKKTPAAKARKLAVKKQIVTDLPLNPKEPKNVKGGARRFR